MSEKNANAPVSANDKPPAGGNAAVIRRMAPAEESAQERLIKKHVPAWVVSGAIHVATKSAAANASRIGATAVRANSS